MEQIKPFFLQEHPTVMVLMYKNKVLLEPHRSPYNSPQHQLTLWNHGYWTTYIHYTLRAWLLPSYRSTHCTYPRMDGQAELTWMAGSITRWRGREWSPWKTSIMPIL